MPHANRGGLREPATPLTDLDDLVGFTLLSRFARDVRQGQENALGPDPWAGIGAHRLSRVRTRARLTIERSLVPQLQSLLTENRTHPLV
jgi:hypothetical protein